jgi:prolipoprotein diacylglyceryl transferase
MSVAYLPSPAQGVWHLGPVPVRAYALCAVLGIVVALWVTDRRYRRMGGPQGMILDVATVAVPVGIVGARIYGVLSDYRLYFGAGRDWVSVLRIWDGGLGAAAVVAAGAAGAWAYCHRYHYSLAPMALAAAPALALAQAIGTWGNWFSQRMYGSPSTLPFAVAIGPARRANGYESFTTFQPVFLYESLWDVLIAVGVAYAIRRLLLTGDRAFALYAVLYAVGRLTAEIARIDYSPRLLGTRVTEFGMLLVIIAGTAYLAISRARRRPPAAGQVPVAGQVGIAAGGRTGAASGSQSPNAAVSAGPVSAGPISPA